MNQQAPTTLVVIPTYNESTTLPITLDRLRAAVPYADVLVVDDNSPDGTGAVADRISSEDSHVHVLHREGKQGLGTAYIAGFRWGLEREYDVLVEMDADGSHRAVDLPRILAQLELYPEAALVLGSRWVSGGTTENWPMSRKLISRAGNTYVQLALGLPLGDATGGFRAYRATTLQALDLGSVASQGYCFQVDMVWRIHQTGAQIIEVPITFVEREAGESKMSGDIVRESLLNVTVWGAKHRALQVRDLTVSGVAQVKKAIQNLRD